MSRNTCTFPWQQGVHMYSSLMRRNSRASTLLGGMLQHTLDSLTIEKAIHGDCNEVLRSQIPFMLSTTIPHSNLTLKF